MTSIITIIIQGLVIKIGTIIIEKTATATINSEIKIGLQLLIVIAWKEITQIKAEAKAETRIQKREEIKKEKTKSIFYQIKKFSK